MRVGFIGLGAMGVPMALNLVKAGHAVRGFDVRPRAADALVAAGGAAAASAADAAKDAELLWLMVVSGEQVEAVLFEPVGTVNTGDAVDPRRRDVLQRI